MQSFVDENGRPYIIMRGKRLFFFFFLCLLCCFWFAFSALFTNARLCLSDGFSVFFRFFSLVFLFFLALFGCECFDAVFGSLVRCVVV